MSTFPGSVDSFPNAAQIAGHLFSDVNGGSLPMHTWMGQIGDAIEATQTYILSATNVPNLLTNIVASSGATQNVNFSTASTWQITLNSDCNITLSGAVANRACTLTILFIQDATGGHDFSFVTGVNWTGGVTPTMPQTGHDYVILKIMTLDGGATWYGYDPVSTTGGGGGSASIPDAPNTVVASGVTNSTVSVSFIPGSSNGSSILNYTVTCVSSDGGVTASATGSSSPITVTGLSTAKTYTAVVHATNSIGVGPNSLPSGSFTTAAVVPGIPTNVTAVAGNATALVTFAAPASNGGSAITGYTVTCTSSDGGTTRTNSGASSPITVSSLTNTKHYTATVHATNGVGNSAESSPSSSFIPSAGGGTAQPIQNLSVIAANEHIFGSFSPPASGTPISYLVQVSGQVGVADMTIATTGNSKEKFIFDNIIMTSDGGANVVVSVTATTSDGTASAVSTGSLPVTKVSPLKTFSVDGDRLSGVWENTTVRDTVAGTPTDYAVGTLVVDNTTNFTADTVRVGKIFNPVTAASGVQVRLINCKIKLGASSGRAQAISADGVGGKRFDLHYCFGSGDEGPSVGTDGIDEFNGINQPYSQSLIHYKNYSTICCYVTYCVHAFSCSGDATIKWSSCDFTRGNNIDHYDGFFFDQGPNVTLRGNHLAVGTGNTASIVASSFVDNGAMTNSDFEDNWIEGGGYALYYGVTSHPGSTNTNQTIKNNRWTRSFQTASPFTIPVGSFTLTVTRTTSPTQGVPIPASGTLLMGMDDGTWADISYTGKSGNTFTGCTANSGIGKVITPMVSYSNYLAGTTYPLGAVVQFSGHYMVSLQNGNVGNTPVVDGATAFWADTPQQGSIRVYSGALCMSGRWPRGGWFGVATANAIPSGTWVHTNNVWDDDGTSVSASLN